MTNVSDYSIPEFESLVHKFTELLTGEADPERMEMVKVWCIYSHISKVMPPLVKHWAGDPQNADAKAKIRKIFEDIQRMNEENKTKIRQHQSMHLNQKGETGQ